MKLDLIWPRGLLTGLASINPEILVVEVHHGAGRVHAVTASWKGRGDYVSHRALFGAGGRVHHLEVVPVAGDPRRCSCEIKYQRQGVQITTAVECSLHGRGAGELLAA